MINSIVATTVTIGGVTFQYVDILLVTILCLVSAIVAGLWLPKLGYEWCALRRVPAMDVIDEAVEICAEKGRPLFQSMGTMAYTTSIFVESVVSLARYLTKQCGALGVRYITVCQNPQLQLLLYDFAKQGYIEAGRPEMFNAKDIRYVVSGMTQNQLENIDAIRMDKPASFIGVCDFNAGICVPIFQEAVTAGCFIIGSSYWPDELAQVAMSSDYALMTAEVSIVGAYIDNDPEKMAPFIGEDVVKLILIGITIGLGILWMAGVKIFV